MPASPAGEAESSAARQGHALRACRLPGNRRLRRRAGARARLAGKRIEPHRHMVSQEVGYASRISKSWNKTLVTQHLVSRKPNDSICFADFALVQVSGTKQGCTVKPLILKGKRPLALFRECAIRSKGTLQRELPPNYMLGGGVIAEVQGPSGTRVTTWSRRELGCQLDKARHHRALRYRAGQSLVDQPVSTPDERRRATPPRWTSLEDLWVLENAARPTRAP